MSKNNSVKLLHEPAFVEFADEIRLYQLHVLANKECRRIDKEGATPSDIDNMSYILKVYDEYSSRVMAIPYSRRHHRLMSCLVYFNDGTDTDRQVIDKYDFTAFDNSEFTTLTDAVKVASFAYFKNMQEVDDVNIAVGMLSKQQYTDIKKQLDALFASVLPTRADGKAEFCRKADAIEFLGLVYKLRIRRDSMAKLDGNEFDRGAKIDVAPINVTTVKNAIKAVIASRCIFDTMQKVSETDKKVGVK